MKQLLHLCQAVVSGQCSSELGFPLKDFVQLTSPAFHSLPSPPFSSEGIRNNNGDKALICVPAPMSPGSAEDADLSPPAMAVASLDCDSVSFQCSPPHAESECPGSSTSMRSRSASLRRTYNQAASPRHREAHTSVMQSRCSLNSVLD